MKKNQKDKLYIQLVELREFMLTHDENTWSTERELAARIVNSMIASMAVRDDCAHKYFSILGLRESGVSNEGCQEDLISSADTYNSHVKSHFVREFSDGNGGLFKVNSPVWLQAPFEDGKVISDSWFKVVFEIMSKWGNRPAAVTLVTKKERALNLNVFEEFMTTLVASKYPKLEWGVVDTSEWKNFELFKPTDISNTETKGGSKKRKTSQKINNGSEAV